MKIMTYGRSCIVASLAAIVLLIGYCSNSTAMIIFGTLVLIWMSIVMNDFSERR